MALDISGTLQQVLERVFDKSEEAINKIGSSMSETGKAPTASVIISYLTSNYQPLNARLTSISNQAAPSGTTKKFIKLGSGGIEFDTEVYQPAHANLTALSGLSRETRGFIYFDNGDASLDGSVVTASSDLSSSYIVVGAGGKAISTPGYQIVQSMSDDQSEVPSSAAVISYTESHYQPAGSYQAANDELTRLTTMGATQTGVVERYLDGAVYKYRATEITVPSAERTVMVPQNSDVLTLDKIILGNGSHNVKASSYSIVDTWGDDASLVGFSIPTQDAILEYLFLQGYTSNTGTVTQITAGKGLAIADDKAESDTKGSITTNGTLYLTLTGVTAGTYQGIQVDKYGRVVNASDMGYTTNTGDIERGNSTALSANYFVEGYGTKKIIKSSFKGGKSTTSWDSTSDVYLPTMKAIASYVTGLGYTTNSGTVTSVRVQASSPVVSSTSTAQTGSLDTTISLATAYGDTQNPYGNKTKNYVLAGPDGSSGHTADAAPSFRALVSDDIPNLAASKINSGTFDAARIPSLAASKINSGTFDAARIPSLASSKLTSWALQGIGAIPNSDTPFPDQDDYVYVASKDAASASMFPAVPRKYAYTHSKLASGNNDYSLLGYRQENDTITNAAGSSVSISHNYDAFFPSRFSSGTNVGGLYFNPGDSTLRVRSEDLSGSNSPIATIEVVSVAASDLCMTAFADSWCSIYNKYIDIDGNIRIGGKVYDDTTAVKIDLGGMYDASSEFNNYFHGNVRVVLPSAAHLGDMERDNVEVYIGSQVRPQDDIQSHYTTYDTAFPGLRVFAKKIDMFVKGYNSSVIDGNTGSQVNINNKPILTENMVEVGQNITRTFQYGKVYLAAKVPSYYGYNGGSVPSDLAIGGLWIY